PYTHTIPEPKKAGAARAAPASRAATLALPGLPVSGPPDVAGAELARSGQWPDNRRAHTAAPLPLRLVGLKRLARGACTARAAPAFLKHDDQNPRQAAKKSIQRARQ